MSTITRCSCNSWMFSLGQHSEICSFWSRSLHEICFWIFFRVIKSIMTMRTSTLSHMSWSITTEEQRLVKMIFHKRPPNLCCWLWICIHIYLHLFFSDWEADPVRHSGSGRDRWPLRRCCRPLGCYKIGWFLKHRPYADWWTALMCEYCIYIFTYTCQQQSSKRNSFISFWMQGDYKMKRNKKLHLYFERLRQMTELNKVRFWTLGCECGNTPRS